MDSKLHYAVYTVMVCRSVFKIIHDDYGLDMYSFVRECLNNDFIYDIYFCKDCANEWWFGKHSAYDIVERLRMLGKLSSCKSKGKKYDMTEVEWAAYLYGFWACIYGIDFRYM